MPSGSPPPPRSSGGSTGWLVAAIMAGVGAAAVVVLALVLVLNRGTLASLDTTGVTPAPVTTTSATITDTDGGYQVVFPNPPAPIRSTVDSSVGKLQLNGWQLDSTVGGVHNVYVLVYVTYPLSLDVSHPDTNLAGAVSGAVTNSHGTLVGSVATVSIGGQPGREFTAKTSKGYVRTLVVLRDHSLYTLEVLGQDPGVAAFDGFAKTFTLT